MTHFFDVKQEWSKYKHTILHKLLEAKLFSRRNIRAYTYVDAMAGTGQYDDGNPGSPLVVLDVMKDLINSYPTNAKINVLLNDSDPINLAKLRNLIAQQSLPSNIKVNTVLSDFYETLENAKHVVGGTKALVFVDPFKLREYSHSPIREFSQWSRDVDLLVNFPFNAFIRTAGKGRNNQTARNTLEAAVELEYNPQHLQYAKQYENHLRAIYKNVAYTSLKNNRGGALFRVFLLTNDVNLARVYNDFAIDHEPSPALMPLAEELLLRHIPKSKAIAQTKLYQKIYNEHFGSYKTKDYNKALRQLLDDGRICRKTSYNSRDFTFDKSNITTQLDSTKYFQQVN